MSLISDTDYLIHSLRLAYLRDADDPYGSRIITLDPSYHANPYIVASSLADPDRWPELLMPSSPPLSEDENENTSGFPGARLKYTQTIMGGRSGGLGLRVHGKRASTSKRLSQAQQAAKAMDVRNFISENAPVQEALSTSAPPVPSSLAKPNTNGEHWVQVDKNEQDKSDHSPKPSVQIQLATAPEEAPVTKVVQFIPKFTAEMEAKRRLRMAARRGPGGAVALPPPPLSFDTSSEDEVEINITSDTSSDEFDVVGGGVDSMDEGDEFDPEFAATRTSATSDSASDVNSVLSATTSSIPNSSGPVSASTQYKGRSRLSPVSENARRAGSRTRSDRPSDVSLDGTTLVPSARPDGDTSSAKKGSGGLLRSKIDRPPSATHGLASSPSTGSSDLVFTRKKLTPLKAQKSALSSMLASSSSSGNPFAEMYATISGRGESASTNVQIYFPHVVRPADKPMELNVRKDATVEEVVGFSLWNYWEKGWLPKLDEGLSDDDPKRESKLSAMGWIIRIAEDDGEVDDDFPPPDRMGKIAKFNADAYAVLEATPSQYQQNKILESKIQRRPSRTLAAKKTERLNVSAPILPSGGPSSSVAGSALGSLPLSTSLGPSFSHGPQIFLRVRVADSTDAVHISTTIPVSAGMYMQEALEMVCRRRRLQTPKDYALLLVLPDTRIMVPLDRTVASLQGNKELLLVKRNMLNSMGLNVSKEIKTTDPNASIFKRMSDTPEQQYSSALDYTAAYKKYIIYRKMPMLVTRQERTLAIDGVYIHIMPSTNKAKAVFDHGKTSSYHIKSIADCQQSAKSSAIFKLILNRGSGNKRYDFEAENPKLATEIVQTIRGMKAALERSGTINKSRRSRQVV